MALTESANIAYGGEQPESAHDHQQTQTQLEESLKDLSASPLNKQNSIFSLTLDEIQLKSGKSFGSMNMDEFLTNLWNVDENQVSSQPIQIQNQNQNQNEQPINDNNIIQTEAVPTLTRQNSFSIPIQICNKTVEQVWSEIQKDQTQQPNIIISNHEPPQRQHTFGEMTLEEFLIKAGVVQEPATTTKTLALSHQQKFETPIQINNSTAACLDSNFGGGGIGTNPMMALGFSTHQNMGNNLLVNGYAAYPIYTPTKIVGIGLGELSNNNNNNVAENDKSHGMLESTGGGLNKSNRKRIIDGPPEVVVERRQRRMIKNRESAARSRARKQAYTVELELELTQLKEENEKLKQTVTELEQKQAQEILKKIKQ